MKLSPLSIITPFAKNNKNYRKQSNSTNPILDNKKDSFDALKNQNYLNNINFTASSEHTSEDWNKANDPYCIDYYTARVEETIDKPEEFKEIINFISLYVLCACDSNGYTLLDKILKSGTPEQFLILLDTVMRSSTGEFPISEKSFSYLLNRDQNAPDGTNNKQNEKEKAQTRQEYLNRFYTILKSSYLTANIYKPLFQAQDAEIIRHLGPIAKDGESYEEADFKERPRFDNSENSKKLQEFFKKMEQEAKQQGIELRDVPNTVIKDAIDKEINGYIIANMAQTYPDAFFDVVQSYPKDTQAQLITWPVAKMLAAKDFAKGIKKLDNKVQYEVLKNALHEIYLKEETEGREAVKDVFSGLNKEQIENLMRKDDCYYDISHLKLRPILAELFSVNECIAHLQSINEPIGSYSSKYHTNWNMVLEYTSRYPEKVLSEISLETISKLEESTMWLDYKKALVSDEQWQTMFNKGKKMMGANPKAFLVIQKHLKPDTVKEEFINQAIDLVKNPSEAYAILRNMLPKDALEVLATKCEDEESICEKLLKAFKNSKQS